MKPIIISTTFILAVVISFGQTFVKVDDKAPAYSFNKMVNAPVAGRNLLDLMDKPTILAFWGIGYNQSAFQLRWLGYLTELYGDKVHIIAIPNANEPQIQLSQLKEPGKICFASDDSNKLFRIFHLECPGHAVLIDKSSRIAGITEIENIDSTVINMLANSSGTGTAEGDTDNKHAEETGGVKSSNPTLYYFIMRPEVRGIRAVGIEQPGEELINRRFTIFNFNSREILSQAYNISSPQKIIYPSRKDSLESNQNLYCLDFSVSVQEEANFKSIYQSELNKHLPVKAKIEKRTIKCFVLQAIKNRPVLIKEGDSMSGHGAMSSLLEFEGSYVPLSSFVGFLEIELQRPVYDATGLTQFYDIHFRRNNTEPLKSTNESLEKLGLELVKGEREMDVLVISTR